MTAIELNRITGDVMLMDRRTDAAGIFDDEEEFMMLSAEVISDLIDDGPDICTIDDVKVRF